MAERCEGCGSDLFPGQRFCRVCGRPSGQLVDGNSLAQVMSPAAESAESLTQMMPPPPGGAQTGRVQGDTAPTARPAMGQGYQPSVADYYQPSMQTPAPVYLPPRKKSKAGLILVIIGLVVFGSLIFGILRAARQLPGMVIGGRSSRPIAGETLLNEASADLTGDQTVISKTYPLATGSRLIIHNPNGDVDVQAWDQPNAEVRIIKTGGSALDRANTKVYYVARSDRLGFRTDARSMSHVSVRYEVKVPRELGLVEIQGTNSQVALNGINGDISIRAENGSVDLKDVSGSAKARTVNGNITAVFDDVAGDKPMELVTVNGNIDAQFKSDVNASVEARSVSGAIDIDSAFGIPVEKRMVGSRASGTIGSGDWPLKLTTVNGNITIGKAKSQG
jgi:hypothetical protein